MEGESEQAREARVKMEIARAEMEMRMRRPPAAESRQGSGGHGAKAGLRGVTLLVVLIAVLGSLFLLKKASKQLELGDDPQRPGVGRSR